jgi:lipopolysaccharide/colanic/teichoic acid biosynthesis glycosyltransferase
MKTYARAVPFCKRLFDVVFSLLALIILSPVILLLAVWLALAQGWPVLFTQTRPGLGGKLFHLVKFRTMRDARGADGKLLPDEQRITRLGAFLRRSSLDELPEFLNVLKGDMSVVGPRPLLVQYLERYSPQQARRHDVLPGITGWAQVNGRNALTWEEKFALDVWYVDHWSFWLDMRIILLTVWKIFKREGISQPGHATCRSLWGVNIMRIPTRRKVYKPQINADSLKSIHTED